MSEPAIQQLDDSCKGTQFK